MSLLQHIVLIGMPASGKTTVGKILAKTIQRSFYDTDDIVEKTTGQSINDIFRYRGETYFRHKEALTVASLMNLKSAVIATGGGVVLDKHTHQLLKPQQVIYLDTSLEVLWERLKNDTTRPHLNTDKKYEKLQESYHHRKSIYEDVARYTTQTENKGPMDIAADILSLLNINCTLTSGVLCLT